MRQLALLLLCGMLLLAACRDNVDTDNPTPTPPPPSATTTETIAPTLTLVPSPTGPTPVPSATFPATLTPSPTGTPIPPTDTATPPPTPGPFEDVVREGDDCLQIMFRHGHADNALLYDFFALNEMPGRCILGPPGSPVLVPRPPVAVQLDAAGEVIPTNTPWVVFVEAVGQYCAEEGDTLTSIALKNDTTNRRICELNPMPDGINCGGCDFSADDVTGFCPNPPQIGVGQCLNVPGSTPTPTATNLPTGEETATATPTLRPPQMVFPTEGQVVRGLVRLQWVSVGVLQADEYYVVHVTNEATQEFFAKETRNTSLEVPQEFFARVGGEQSVSWSIAVERRIDNGLFQPVGVRTPAYSFVWQP